jgi:hypothetical protein
VVISPARVECYFDSKTERVYNYTLTSGQCDDKNLFKSVSSACEIKGRVIGMIWYWIKGKVKIEDIYLTSDN